MTPQFVEVYSVLLGNGYEKTFGLDKSGKLYFFDNFQSVWVELNCPVKDFKQWMKEKAEDKKAKLNINE